MTHEPKFGRCHYYAVAECIRDLDWNRDDPQMAKMREHVAERFADMFKTFNPNFKPAMFLDACTPSEKFDRIHP